MLEVTNNSTVSATDTTPPMINTEAGIEMSTTGLVLAIDFNEALDGAAEVPLSHFSITVDGVSVTPFSVRVYESRVSLQFATGNRIQQGQAVVATYTDPTAENDDNVIQDVAGNDLASFTTGEDGVPAVTNNSTFVPDTTPPTLSSATTGPLGNQVGLAFSENLSPLGGSHFDLVPSFGVLVSGASLTVTSVTWNLQTPDQLGVNFTGAFISAGRDGVGHVHQTVLRAHPQGRHRQRDGELHHRFGRRAPR